MTPLFFGHPEEQLYGVYHPPLGGTTSAALLLCYPVGHEYMRAHECVCRLATALAKAGWPVLRFDYWGTGDSVGADMDVTLARWDESVCLAAAELKDMSGASRLSLVGLRFGAVLAARYATTAPVQDLLLWDPVVSGEAYLDELRALHNGRLAERRGTPVTAAPATPASSDIAGSQYPPLLREAIGSCDLRRNGPWCSDAAHAVRPPERSMLIASADLPAYRDLQAALPATSRYDVCLDDGQWNEAARWGDPLRPRAIPARIVDLLKRELP
ncbi:MAG: hypothetical protein HQ523_13890 [Lentisphaerae bacterium]|nr:hypothetical protein [Lentisphaerota bacterium]